MKTGEIAKMMGLNPKTITNWTDQEDLAPFFSDEARRNDESSFQREYTEDDVFVINTIRINKNRQNTWKDVAGILATGHREAELPITANLTKTISPADQIAAMMAVKSERDTALAQLQDALFEIERLRKEMKQDREQTGKVIADLNREIGRLENKIEMIEQRLKDAEE